MKYNIKVISDIHFGCKDDKLLWNELQEKFFKTIDKNLDLLVVAGDLFHRVIKMNEPASQYVFSFIDQLDKYSKLYNFKIRILKGTKSHDFNQLENFKHYELNNDNFGIADKVCVEEVLDGMTVLYIPEEYVNNEEEYYKDYFNEKYDMIFFHGTMDFAAFSSHVVGNKNSKQAPNFKSNQIANMVRGAAIGGHIHIKQNYNKKIYYTGSFSRYNFGEEEDKGFIDCIYDTENKKCEVSYVKNDLAPAYLTVKLSDLKGDLKTKLEKIEILKENIDNLRIDIEENDKKGNETIIEAIKELSNDNIKLKVSNSFEEKYDEKYTFILKKTLPLNETIQKFIEITKNKKISIERIDKILNTKD